MIAWLAGRRAALVFGAANLLFLLVDVALAHSSFVHSRAEMIPLAVSALGGTLALLAAVLPEGATARALIWFVAATSIATGVAGLALHLGDDALTHPSLQRLVYSAPILAPLSYAGLGFLLLAAEHARSATARGRLLLLLAGLGMAGNFFLCLMDHAQNGFWAPIEWISVAAGAAGALALAGAAAVRERTPAEERFVWLLLAAMAGVAVLGAALHLRSVLASSGPTLLWRFQYGAPVFAPMLFFDLACLGALGLLAARPAAHQR
jgi:hypothetical protein